jgi:hypothetical protein
VFEEEEGLVVVECRGYILSRTCYVEREREREREVADATMRLRVE